MNDWQNYLKTHGAQFQEGEIHSFGENPGDYGTLLGNNTLLFALNHLGTLTLRSDAQTDGVKKLLQGQVTCDVDKLTPEQALPGAHCTPQGRTIADFQLLQNTDNSVDMILPWQQQEAVVKSLSRYTPFFKVSLDKGNRHLLGLAGPNASVLCETAIGALPASSGHSAHNRGNSAIALGDGRYLLLADPEHIETLWESLASQATAVGTPLWTLLNIRAGIGAVTPSTREEFVPQMLNLQAIDAISFKKGCYTGQEVVARMHYLGKLKRRMYRLQIAASIAPADGQHCYVPGKPQSQGTVVCAANSDQQTVEMLAVLTEQAASSQQLLIGNSLEEAQTVATKPLPLPYSTDAQR